MNTKLGSQAQRLYHGVELHRIRDSGYLIQFLFASRDAAMRHITTTFDLYRSQLKAKLQASVSKIHLSTDLWTSPHRHGILAVCARWVDNSYRPKKALLAMPECRYSHSGERQATLMAEAIEEYGIAKQIGYHTGDNATSNDTCLKHLSQMLQDKYGVCYLEH
jgi:hypothetical protein